MSNLLSGRRHISSIPINGTCTEVESVKSTKLHTGIYIIKESFPFLEIPYFLAWTLNGIDTSSGEFSAVVYALSLSM